MTTTDTDTADLVLGEARGPLAIPARPSCGSAPIRDARPAASVGPGAAGRSCSAVHHQVSEQCRLAERAAAQRLADWLEQRPQLEREVFGRGVAEPVPGALPAADITELLRACLKLLELPARDRVYRPNPPRLWRVPDALAHMHWLLTGLPPDGAPLERFLPAGGEAGRASLQRRAALASTLMASLELSREVPLPWRSERALVESKYQLPPQAL